jgi:N-acetylmuramoyl-L-alanine amidase
VLRPTDLAGFARRGLALGLLLGSGAAWAACDRAGFVVAIDPGHTRASPGATSARGIPEVRFNEVLARRVMAALQAAGFSAAFLINRDQATVSLDERAQRANQRGANLFVSIHHDSAQPHRLSTWTHRGRKLLYTDEIRGYSLFVSERNGDAAGSLRFARLLGTSLRRACLAPTLHHAEKIPGENRELLDEALGIYRFDELVVLRSTRMPALLFEAGVIVNRDEEKLLRSPRHQKKLAAALTEAVVDFCEGSPVPPAPQPDCR